jgi:hypothetical protein
MKTKRVLTFVTSLVTTAVFAAGILAATIGSIAPVHADEHTPKPAEAGINLTGSHGFDFLAGEWRVHHRRISAVSKKWVEFEGTVSHRSLMNGSANVEEYALDSPDGAYHALNLRAYDKKADRWSIWWLDERYPEGPIGPPPAQGRFENGIGTFYTDYQQDGKPMRGRLMWSDITPTSARWQQATSADGGKTWEPNWFMELQRSQIPQARATRQKASDFAFLEGDWQVQHRYIRVKPDGREWVEVPGTVSHREYQDGWANVEDYVMNGPGGPSYAVAMRSYNPKNAQWTVWWLDGRNPSSMEEPMKGRFESGVGTFFGSTTIDGKPTRVHFTWSDTTTASPRWQQDYSYDDGKSWETVWIMQFQRGTATASIASAQPAERKPQPAHPSINLTGAHGFDFLAGEWRVHHRRISPATGKWVEFDGTCNARLMMEGSASVEEHLLNSPSGPYRAIGLHSYDATTGKWSNWWLDGRYPAGPLDPPVQGTFENGVASTYSEFDKDGKKAIARLKWLDITATSFRFEQSSSADGGKTWETNWMMEFARAK